MADTKVALRKELVRAMRSQHFVYKGVYKVRQKLRVKRMVNGRMESLWCDAETAHPQFWEDSLKQNWETLADHSFRVYSTLKYYNEVKNPTPDKPFQLQFDFTDENADREQRPPGGDSPDPDDDGEDF